MPKIFSEYGSYNKRLNSWFHGLRPLVQTTVNDLPDSNAKTLITKYVSNALSKLVQDCDLNPRYDIIQVQYYQTIQYIYFQSQTSGQFSLQNAVDSASYCALFGEERARRLLHWWKGL